MQINSQYCNARLAIALFRISIAKYRHPLLRRLPSRVLRRRKDVPSNGSQANRKRKISVSGKRQHQNKINYKIQLLLEQVLDSNSDDHNGVFLKRYNVNN